MGIKASDQINLVFPGAAFDLLLASNGVFNFFSSFKIDKFVNIVVFRKSFYFLAFMLQYFRSNHWSHQCRERNYVH